MKVTDGGIETEVKLLQPSKALEPIEMTDEGIAIEVNPLQRVKQ